MNSSHTDTNGHADRNARSPFLPQAEHQPRIPLPKREGPPLDAIASIVVAAHDARLLMEEPTQPAFSAVTPAPTSAFDSAAAAETSTHEPTLRLDAKQLKREHARLQAGQGRAKAAGWPHPLALTVGVALLSAALTAGGVLWLRPSAFTPTASSLPKVNGTSSAENAVVLSSGRPPLTSARLPLPPKSRPAVAHAVKRSGVSSAAILASVTVKAPTIRRHAASVERELPPRHRTRSKAFVETDAVPARRHEPLVSSAHASAVHDSTPRSHRTGRDEDTFASHSHAVRGDSADEWTDRIP